MRCSINLSPRSNQSRHHNTDSSLRIIGWTLLVLASTLATQSAHAQLPDLQVRIEGPSETLAGEDIGPKLKIMVSNRGKGIARGTASAGKNGYMVDVFLTRKVMPAGFANYSDHYHAGVLLRGGRISNTEDLKPNTRRGYRSGGGLPADTPVGEYRLCARVDPGHAVVESDEDNNVACMVLKVSMLQVAPPPHLTVVGKEPAVEGEQPAAESIQRSVLPDGTLQLKYPDGTLRQRRPNGQVVTIFPDGRTMVPKALQVQPADLPTLPEDLTDWGSHIKDSLLSIIQGLLSEPEYEAYLQTEQDKPYYELVDWRLNSIRFLTAEQ